MTTRPSTPPPASDREALSALFDGELVGDAARFALKRLDHDQDWRATCERWQAVGDVLRNRNAPLPATFPYRVRAAVHAHAQQAGLSDMPPRATARNGGGFRWGSVALAASAAVVAFFLARSPIGGADAPSAPAQVASAIAPTAPAPSQPAPATQLPDTPGADLESATAAVAVAAIARPTQRNRNLQRDRAATDRIVSSVVAARSAVTGEAGPAPVTRTVPDALASDARGENATVIDTAVVDTAAVSPFSSEPVTEMRPWPRAVLPQYGGGALATGLSERDNATTPSFYPFVPGTSASRAQETQTPGDARSAPSGATTNPQSPPPPSP